MTLTFKNPEGEELQYFDWDSSLPSMPRKGEKVKLKGEIYTIRDIVWDFKANSRGGTIGRLYSNAEITYHVEIEEV